MTPNDENESELANAVDALKRVQWVNAAFTGPLLTCHGPVAHTRLVMVGGCFAHEDRDLVLTLLEQFEACNN